MVLLNECLIQKSSRHFGISSCVSKQDYKSLVPVLLKIDSGNRHLFRNNLKVIFSQNVPSGIYVGNFMEKCCLLDKFSELYLP